MTGSNYGEYERHFEMEPAAELSEISGLPEWKEDVIWGENWVEPIDDPRKAYHWQKPPQGANSWSHLDHEEW